MTVDAWVLEAVTSASSRGASVREIQRHIDERRFEELAMDTLEASLAPLLAAGRVRLEGERYFPAKRTSKEEALSRLFGEE